MKKRIKCAQGPRELQPCERPRPSERRGVTQRQALELLSVCAMFGAALGPGLRTGR